MAEPKTAVTGPGGNGPSLRRRWRVWLAGRALAVVAGGLWFSTPIMGYARTGASYAAHVGCSCRHIGGRTLASCRTDFEPGMGVIMLSEDAEARRVTARFPLLATETATYRAGQGCVLEPWRD